MDKPEISNVNNNIHMNVNTKKEINIYIASVVKENE